MFREIGKVGRIGISQTFREPRLYLAWCLWGLSVGPQMNSLREVSAAAGYAVHPYVLPFFFQNIFMVVLMAMGALMVFCDVPGVTENSYYQIVRCGRRVWFWGQMVRMLLVGFLYTAGVALLPLLYLLGQLEWKAGWGKILGSLAQMSVVGGVESHFRASYRIIASFSPGEAIVLVCLILYLNVLLIGSLTLFGNILISKSMGAVLGAAMAFLPYLTIRLSDLNLAYYIAPLAWLDLGLFQPFMGSGMPTLPYVFAVLIGGNLLCIMAAYFGIMKKDMVLQNYH